MSALTLPADGVAGLWTPQQAAAYLGRAVHTLENWRTQYAEDDPRCLPYLRWRGRIYYDPAETRRFAARNIQPRRATQPGD